jgi:hypothetical protein
MRELYTENLQNYSEKTEHITKWKDILCSWNRILNRVGMMMLADTIYRFTVTSINIPMIIFAKRRNILKLIHKLKELWIAKIILKKDQNCQHCISCFENIQQSYSNQNSVANA